MSVGQLAIATWGVGGVLALLVQAVWRLTPVALEPIVGGQMTWWQWTICIVWVVVNAHAEGHRGFHQNFSPRVVARAFHLGRQPTPLSVALAPLFCMGLFHATRRVLITAWTLLLAILALILWVRTLDQPWRGIIDAGVVVGLAWGMLSLLWYYARAAAMGAVPPRADLPGSG